MLISNEINKNEIKMNILGVNINIKPKINKRISNIVSYCKLNRYCLSMGKRVSIMTGAL